MKRYARGKIRYEWDEHSFASGGRGGEERKAQREFVQGARRTTYGRMRVKSEIWKWEKEKMRRRAGGKTRPIPEGTVGDFRRFPGSQKRAGKEHAK